MLANNEAELLFLRKENKKLLESLRISKEINLTLRLKIMNFNSEKLKMYDNYSNEGMKVVYRAN